MKTLLSATKILKISILVALLISTFWGLYHQSTTKTTLTKNHDEMNENKYSSRMKTNNMNSMDDDMNMNMDDDDDDDDGMDDDKSNKFCKGMMSMTMAMDGFQFSLNKNGGDCLTYFVSPWKLNSTGKFHGAMIYSFLLALMTEGITAFQLFIRKYLPSHGKLRKFVMTTLYGIQQWLGYITMLITMMYSIELFGCVIAGIVVGRILFSKHIPDNITSTTVGGGGGAGGGSSVAGSASYRSISTFSRDNNNNSRGRNVPPIVNNGSSESQDASSSTKNTPSSSSSSSPAVIGTNLRRRRS